MLALKQRWPDHVRVVRNPRNIGVGGIFCEAIQRVNYASISLIPGDNAYHEIGIRRLFQAVQSECFITSYREDMQTRPALRIILSKLATYYVRVLTGKRIRDAHSLFIFPVKPLRKFKIRNNGYGYHMEFLSRLLVSYGESDQLPVMLNPNCDESSRVLAPRALVLSGFTMLKLLFLRVIGGL